jgi:5-methylcytosine-specific restriction endonuclease McrBC regulatory subunit McrC
VRESENITRKGLSRIYAEHVETQNAVRGRVLVRENLGVPKATLVCRYAELSYDTSENRVLKYALSKKIEPSEMSRRLLTQLSEVPLADMSKASFPRPRWNRLNRHYKKAVDVSRLLTVGIPRRILLDRESGEIQ